MEVVSLRYYGLLPLSENADDVPELIDALDLGSTDDSADYPLIGDEFFEDLEIDERIRQALPATCIGIDSTNHDPCGIHDFESPRYPIAFADQDHLRLLEFMKKVRTFDHRKPSFAQNHPTRKSTHIDFTSHCSCLAPLFNCALPTWLMASIYSILNVHHSYSVNDLQRWFKDFGWEDEAEYYPEYIQIALKTLECLKMIYREDSESCLQPLPSRGEYSPRYLRKCGCNQVRIIPILIKDYSLYDGERVVNSFDLPLYRMTLSDYFAEQGLVMQDVSSEAFAFVDCALDEVWFPNKSLEITEFHAPGGALSSGLAHAAGVFEMSHEKLISLLGLDYETFTEAFYRNPRKLSPSRMNDVYLFRRSLGFNHLASVCPSTRYLNPHEIFALGVSYSWYEMMVNLECFDIPNPNVLCKLVDMFHGVYSRQATFDKPVPREAFGDRRAQMVPIPLFTMHPVPDFCCVKGCAFEARFVVLEWMYRVPTFEFTLCGHHSMVALQEKCGIDFNRLEYQYSPVPVMTVHHNVIDLMGPNYQLCGPSNIITRHLNDIHWSNVLPAVKSLLVPDAEIYFCNYQVQTLARDILREEHEFPNLRKVNEFIPYDSAPHLRSSSTKKIFGDDVY